MPSMRLNRLRLEALEDRCLLAIAVWITPGEGSWFQGSNWRDGRIPGPGDDVVITQPGAVVRFSPLAERGETDNIELNSLICTERMVITNGTISVASTASIHQLTLLNGTLASNASLSFTGEVQWLGGTLSAAHSIDFFGMTTARSSLLKTFDTPTVNNFGFWLWSQGEIRDREETVFVNKPGSICRFEGGLQFRLDGLNYGRWVFESSTLITLPRFENYGHLTLARGQLRVTTFEQYDGSLWLLGGGLYTALTATLFRGTLLGSGRIDGSVLNLGARFALGGATLEITGDYLHGEQAVLEVSLSGPARAGRFDQLIVRGLATIRGALELLILPPDLGINNRYPILQAGVLQGRFANFDRQPFADVTLIQQVRTTSIAILAFVPEDRIAEVIASRNSQIYNVNPFGDNLSPINSGDLLAEVLASSATGILLANENATNLDTAGALFASTVDNGSQLRVYTLLGSGDALVAARSQPLVSSIDRVASGRGMESSGSTEQLAQELQAMLLPPELELPAEEDLFSSRDLVQEMLLTRRGRTTLLPQGGTQGGLIAAAIPGTEAEGEARPEERSTFSNQFLDPLLLRHQADDLPEEVPSLVIPLLDNLQSMFSSEDVVWLALSLLVGGVTWPLLDDQRKLCSGPGKLPSRTSRQ